MVLTCAKYERCMSKYFAIFSLIVLKIHLYRRSRYSSTLLIENKAHYLEITAGLLQYLERFLQAAAILEKILNFVFFDCPRANTTRKHAASR